MRTDNILCRVLKETTWNYSEEEKSVTSEGFHIRTLEMKRKSEGFVELNSIWLYEEQGSVWHVMKREVRYIMTA